MKSPIAVCCPEGVENLWVAGRCISATHAAFGSARVMATCMAIGQAAGTAAALASQSGLRTREVDAKLIRKLLIDQGQYLLNEKVNALINEKLVLKRKDGSGEHASHYNPFK